MPAYLASADVGRASSGSRAIPATRTPASRTSTACSCSPTRPRARHSRSWTRRGSPRSARPPPACSASARSPSGRSRRSASWAAAARAACTSSWRRRSSPGLARATPVRPPSGARGGAGGLARGARREATVGRADRRSREGADLVITTAAIVRGPSGRFGRSTWPRPPSPARSTSTRPCPRTCSRTRRCSWSTTCPSTATTSAGLLRGLPGRRRWSWRRARPARRAPARPARVRPARDRPGGRGGRRRDQPPGERVGARHRAPALVDQPLRHPRAPPPARAPRRTRSGAASRSRSVASKPKHAWRTSSTSWWSGLNCAATCTPSGSWSIGKNVPATRNSGVMNERRHVAELVDLRRPSPRRRSRTPAKPSAVTKQNSGTSSMPGAGSSPNSHRHDQREAAVEARAQPDPQHLGGDQLLDVDRRGQDRVVGALEALLDERAEHRRQRAREDHRRGDHAGADELDVARARRPCSTIVGPGRGRTPAGR